MNGFIELILIDYFNVFVKCFYKYMVHELGVGKISEVYYRVCKSSPLVPRLSQMYSIHFLRDVF